MTPVLSTLITGSPSNPAPVGAPPRHKNDASARAAPPGGRRAATPRGRKAPTRQGPGSMDFTGAGRPTTFEFNAPNREKSRPAARRTPENPGKTPLYPNRPHDNPSDVASTRELPGEAESFEFGIRNSEFGIRNIGISEIRNSEYRNIGNSEFGIRNSEFGISEFGIRNSE